MSDCNDALITGKYAFNKSSLHVPVSDSFGLIFVFSNQTDPSAAYLWTFQFAVVTGQNMSVYYRKKVNATGSWTAWSALN